MFQQTLCRYLITVTAILAICLSCATSQVASALESSPKNHHENVFVLSLYEWYLVVVISRVDDNKRDTINGFHIMYGKNVVNND